MRDSNDGISLTSTSHPRSPWWRRIGFVFRPSRLSKDNLETIEIEIPDRKQPTRGLRLIFKPGIAGLLFARQDGQPYEESQGPIDMEYINQLIEKDQTGYSG